MAKPITLENLICIDCGKDEGTISLQNNMEKTEDAIRAGNLCDDCKAMKSDRRRRRRGKY